MSIVASSSPCVKPVRAARAAFRAVKTVDSISWSDFGNRPEVTIHRGNLKKTYHVIPISADFGRAAFRLHKVGTDLTYDLLVNGTESSCSCPGFEYTDGCCHLTAIQMLLDDGTLQVAPGSGAGDENEYSECTDF